MADDAKSERVNQILSQVKALACEYYDLTQRPLGVTGELAELSASALLGLELAMVRTAGYDAKRGDEKIQIKGRALSEKPRPGQGLGRIKFNDDCHIVMLVILDNKTLEVREILEAPYERVIEELKSTPSRARARGSLSISAFRKVVRQYGKRSFPT